MVVAVVSTWLLGFVMLIATSFAILDVEALLETPLVLPMAQVRVTFASVTVFLCSNCFFGQIYYDVLGKRGMLVIWRFVPSRCSPTPLLFFLLFLSTQKRPILVEQH